MENEIIHFDSDKAAKFVTNIEGWVSPDGRFYGKDEMLARYNGCTHRPCEECGESTEKMYTHCAPCREQRAIARYNEKPKKEWDCKAMLYSEVTEKYLYAEDDSVACFLEEMTAEEGRIVICDPQFLSTIAPDDHWQDVIPEDFIIEDVATEALLDAVFDLNNMILKHGPVSWVPGKYAAIIK